MTLRLATRSSPLALEQVRRVVARLESAGIARCEVVIVESEGDRRREVPISQLEVWGAFTNEVERAVLEGRADVAVHSAKDLPSAEPLADMTLAAVPERVDPRDVLVGGLLDELPPGALVLTGAPRRRAQLAHVRPDLCFGEVRGNMAARLSRQPEGGAVVVALAALDRLGIDATGSEILPLSVMLPQVGQGALALRCRSGDTMTIDALELVDDPVAHRALLAERAFLARLGAGCLAPVGAYATVAPDGALLEIEAMIATRDGHVVLRRHLSGDDAEALGSEIATQLLELDGGASIMAQSQ